MNCSEKKKRLLQEEIVFLDSYWTRGQRLYRSYSSDSDVLEIARLEMMAAKAEAKADAERQATKKISNIETEVSNIDAENKRNQYITEVENNIISNQIDEKSFNRS